MSMRSEEKNTALAYKLWWHPKRIAIAKRNGSYRSITLFSNEELESYISNEQYTVAVSPEDRHGNVHFLAFDVDSGRKRDMESLYNGILELTGTPPLVSLSGCKGWHVWIFPDKPLSKQKAVRISKRIADRAGVLGLRYLNDDEDEKAAIEIIPAFDACLKLPGQRHPMTGQLEEFVNLKGNIYDTPVILDGLTAGMFRVPVEKLFVLLPLEAVEKRKEVATKEIDENAKVNELAKEEITQKKKGGNLIVNDDKIIQSIWDLTKMEDVALYLTPGVRRIGQGFYCVLPGHRERHKSAAWFETDSKVILYKDFHARDGQEWYSIPEVYAALKTGKVRKLDRIESTKWLKILAREFGYRTPLVIETDRLFHNLQPTLKNILVGHYGGRGSFRKNDQETVDNLIEFLKNEVIEQAMAGYRELAASKRYIASKTGISPEKVNRAMNLLCLLGAFEKVNGTGGKKGDRYIFMKNFNEDEARHRWEVLGRPNLRSFNAAMVAKVFSDDIARKIFRRNENGTIVA